MLFRSLIRNFVLEINAFVMQLSLVILSAIAPVAVLLWYIIKKDIKFFAPLSFKKAVNKPTLHQPADQIAQLRGIINTHTAAQAGVGIENFRIISD